jgi:hypothetical protein
LKEYKKEEEGCYSLGKQKDRLADKLSKKKQKMDSCNIMIEKNLEKNNDCVFYKYLMWFNLKKPIPLIFVNVGLIF